MLALSLVLFSSACENHDVTLGGPFDNSGKLDVSFSRDIQPLFTANCALSGCHSSSSREALLDLSAAGVFDPSFGAVEVVSLEAPGLLRIAPGNADESYLVAKIEGRQDDVGGGGQSMPLGGAPLSPEAIALIRQWIDDGALPN